ncbi:MAG: spore coat protein CotJB [Bacillota bacterium]
MDERMMLLKRIMELSFTALELNLFLDTHPDDQRALADFNATVQELESARMNYEMKFGPLLNFGLSQSTTPWKWVEGPWPWEVTFEGGM